MEITHERDPRLAAAIAAPTGLLRIPAFSSLMLGHVAQGLAFTAFVAALPMIAVHFGGGQKGEFVSQMMSSLAAFGLMFGAVFSGRILELTGVWWCMVGSLLAIGVFGSTGMFVDDANLLLAGRFVVGFGTACLTTACIWVITERYDHDIRARALGACSSVGSSSALATTLLGGWLAQAFGWRATFAQFAIFAAVGLALTIPGAPRVKPIVGTGEARAGYAYLRRLWPFYLLSLVLMALVFLESIQFPFLLAEDGIKSVIVRSGILSGVTVTCAIASALYGPMQARLRPQLTFAVSTAILCGSLLTMGLLHGFGPAVVCALGFGVYIGLLVPYLMHIVTLWAPVTERGRAIGALTAFTFLGAFVNPLIFAPLRAAFGLHGLFIITGAAAGLLTIGAVVRAINLRAQAGGLAASPTPRA